MPTPDLTPIFAAADKAGIARSRTSVPGSENLLCASDTQLARFAAALTAPAVDLDRFRQWFDAVQDMNQGYLEKADYQLAQRVYEALGMHVPDSVSSRAA